LYHPGSDNLLKMNTYPASGMGQILDANIFKSGSIERAIQHAKNIRCYLEQVKKLEVEIEGLDAWIVWANAYAEKIDPLTRPENLVLKIDENRWW
jgi:hypothetical protein